MERNPIRAGIAAFVITLTLLFGVLGAVRVDCATQSVLHGGAEARPQRLCTVPTEWLPPSIHMLVRVLRAEQEFVATIIGKAYEQI